MAGAAPAAAGAQRDTATISIELLGGFRVRVGTRPVEDGEWRLQKARSLIKLLALATGHRLPRERAVDLLWPELDPEAANNNLYQTLHCVRRALRLTGGEPAVRLGQGIVSLLPHGGVWVDVDAFEAAAGMARRSDDIGLYRAALALYSGDLLPDDLYEDWATWRRESLRDIHLTLFLELARRHKARGELKEAIDMLSQAVHAEPLCEEAHTELMRLYASTGQRGRALKQFHQLRKILAAELEAEPDEDNQATYQAIVAGRFGDDGDVPVEEAVPVARHNLPLALSSFIGRQIEQQEIRALLPATRLLTLMGVGGAGKTRLALQTAWGLLDSYRDGVWMAQLSSLADPRLVPGLLGTILGVEDTGDRPLIDRIVETVQSQQCLLILDNCEHVLEECRALSTRLLVQCPELHILATSRTRLGVTGEMTFNVRPLAHPGDGNPSQEDLAASDAVQLFIERARFRQPSFALTADTAGGIHRICSLVDGIPLGLELAAARAGTLGVDQIAGRLATSGRLLSTTDGGTDPRHQSLDATLDWSYELLEESECWLFRRLAVFEGGWTVEAAEQLCSEDLPGEGTTLELLSRLVDRSLVVVEGAEEGAVRYRLLEPVRQYARDRLRETGEEGEVRRRHAAVYADFAEQAGPGLRGLEAHLWVHRIEVESDNIRAAARWSLEGRPEVGLRIVGALWRFWYSRGFLWEGRELARGLLEIGGDSREIDGTVRASAFNAAGAMAYYQTDAPSALANYQRALALRREIGDRRAEASTLSNIGLVLKDQGERERALPYFESALDLFRQMNDSRGLCDTLDNIGILCQEQGDYERARAFHEESLVLTRDLGEMPAPALNNLGALAIEQGDYARARELLEESLAASVRFGVKRSQGVALLNLGLVDCGEGAPGKALARYQEALTVVRDQGEAVLEASGLEGVASALIGLGDARNAAMLITVSGEIRRRCGAPLPATEEGRVAAIRAAARAQLGLEFDATCAAASRLSVVDAMNLALDAPQDEPV